MMDVPADVSLVNIIKVGKGKLLVASDGGHGLIVDIDSALAKLAVENRSLTCPGRARLPVVSRKETMLQWLAKTGGY